MPNFQKEPRMISGEIKITDTILTSEMLLLTAMGLINLEPLPSPLQTPETTKLWLLEIDAFIYKILTSEDEESEIPIIERYADEVRTGLKKL